MAHSPGPWSLSPHSWRRIISAPGDGYITRDVCVLDASTMSAFSQEDNARLIAAAPELLKALEDLYEAYGRSVASDDWDAEVTRAASAAILKAGGAI